MKVCLLICLLLLLFTPSLCKAGENKLPVDIYRVDYNSINSFNAVEKGSKFTVVLHNDISSANNKVLDPVDFLIVGDNGLALMAQGFVSMKKEPGRMQKPASLQLTTSRLVLEDGREISFPASSFLLNSAHPPHANTDAARIARYVSLFSLGASPLTFGSSLGVSFLVSGFLSAFQNGASDFVWGGLDGSGLSFLEYTFRKQPELYLKKGMEIPFVLNEDVKVNNSVFKEPMQYQNLPKEDVIKKIQTLIRWGDLTGALEFSIKTGQEKIYKELLGRISNY